MGRRWRPVRPLGALSTGDLLGRVASPPAFEAFKDPRARPMSVIRRRRNRGRLRGER